MTSCRSPRGTDRDCGSSASRMCRTRGGLKSTCTTRPASI
jgi:hypothetical protein